MRFIFINKIFSKINYLGIKNKKYDVEVDNSNNKIILIFFIKERIGETS